MNTATITKVAREWLKTMGYIGLCILSVALLIYVLQASSIIGKDPEWPPLIFNSFTAPLVFLTLGIVLPVRYSKRYLALGVTRKQLFGGMIVATFVATLVTALFLVVTSPDTTALTAESFRFGYITQHYLMNVVGLIFYNLCGLLIALGFLCRNLFTAAAGLLVGYSGLTFVANLATSDNVWGSVSSTSYWTSGIGFSWEINPQFYHVVPFPLYIAALGLLIVAVAVIAYILSKRIMVKTP